MNYDSHGKEALVSKAAWRVVKRIRCTQKCKGHDAPQRPQDKAAPAHELIIGCLGGLGIDASCKQLDDVFKVILRRRRQKSYGHAGKQSVSVS